MAAALALSSQWTLGAGKRSLQSRPWLWGAVLSGVACWSYTEKPRACSRATRTSSLVCCTPACRVQRAVQWSVRRVLGVRGGTVVGVPLGPDMQ